MRVLLGLSGGFDSAYSAKLLMQAGNTVEGAVLDMHQYTEIAAAECAAKELGIPLHRIDCRDLFEEVVVSDFCREYLCGRTPNPCIICNERVKFRKLCEYAKKEGFDRIATGHYARISQRDGRLAITVAADIAKDQSYMLYRLPQDVLEMLMLPMGEILKTAAKKTELAASLSAVEREDSQEICFIKGEKYTDFIENRCGASPVGSFVSESGEVLGTHKGIVHYTVGQRKGLGISASSRLFVHEIDPVAARIVLSDTPPRTLRFAIDSPVFSGMTREEVIALGRLYVRVRYTAKPILARIEEVNGRLCCELDEPARAVVALGQSAVFYFEDTVAFGGIITNIT